MLTIKKFVFNPFTENTFLVWDEESLETAVIDPGCIDSIEEAEVQDYINKNSLTIKYLLNTHCHIDHILGCSFIKKKYNVPYIVPEDDLPLLNNADKQAAAFGIEIELPPFPDRYFEENESLQLGKFEMKPLFTPGHTPGEFCLYFPEARCCITGDVLFQNSIGRTDLWGGDYETLISSIQQKLLTLPDETVIYPGHGENSTIGKEKAHNSFLKGTI